MEKRLLLLGFAFFIISLFNIYIMHQYMAISGFMEDELFLYSFPVNICITFFDVSLLLLFFYVICFFNIKKALYITSITTLIVAFVNVFYARFFSQYLSLSAFTQVNSLFDSIVLDSMFAGFQWNDLLFFLSFLLIFGLIVKTWKIDMRISRRYIVLLICMPIISILGVIVSYTAYHICNSTCRNNYELYKSRINDMVFSPLGNKDAFPNYLRYHVGFLRPLFSDMADLFMPYELTDEKRKKIENELSDYQYRVTNHIMNRPIDNVIFLLLESYLSASSELIIDGKTITPFLDSLKRSSDVYYNGKVHSNITIGESGDGQLIYMTGLLPLRSKLSVGVAKNDTLPSLPAILKNKLGITRTEIVIPSNPGMWQQNNMNIVYGIDNCYSQNDNQGSEMTDDVVFNMAMNTPKKKDESFFSMVLSLSTHQPYRSPIDKTFEIHCDSLPFSYLVYLNACHFLDKQIKCYFDNLKNKGIYENSLIVIASDHAPHMEMLGMKGRISDTLPLYIIHGNIKNNAYVGDCNQVDVFTTILDVLNIDNDWRGLGNTLLNPNYVNSVSNEKYEMSEWIIQGNYFKSKDYFK